METTMIEEVIVNKRGVDRIEFGTDLGTRRLVLWTMGREVVESGKIEEGGEEAITIKTTLPMAF